ncbi:MFS transporter [Micromonospora sp. KC213]|uniref:MFS transporter n=1 Tax=Micromonospora sp. KC213 TaxID=2530378 RepID=UPI001FB85558|nr:MFS transporter [Micromonospora sp. KC213]
MTLTLRHDQPAAPDQQANPGPPPVRFGRLLAELRGMPPLLRLLIGTQLAFNIGFYAVLPYLSSHLADHIGLAGWLVGLVLGLRTFSQQGLFVVGGALTDRLGPRPVVLAGCALRVAGFAGLAVADGIWSVLASVLLIGFAAALFSPAVESEVARQAVEHETAGHAPRTRVLAIFSVAGQIGAFTGPALGALLLLVDFRVTCLGGAVVFVAILAGHARLMPHRTTAGPAAAGRTGGGTWPGVRGLCRNRSFLLLALAYSGYLVSYNQLYLALPEEIIRTSGSATALAWMFTLSSLLVITAQLPVTGWVTRNLCLRTSLVAGLATIAAGFAVVAAARPFELPGPAGLLPATGLVVLLTTGQMLVVPAARALLPDLAGAGHLGLYTGALSTISGTLVLVGSALTGLLLDSAGDQLGGTLPWLTLTAIPLTAAFAACRLRP